ncbi:MAG: hypothetical protein NVV63_15835 [Opitutus sp.]|nr:hypothetical protein [Opitutus sp.]
MPSRDYVLRLVEQVGEFLARILRQKEEKRPQEALQSVMAACERLFGLEAVRVFQFTPEQQIALLKEGTTPDEGREKVMMYAALLAESAGAFEQLGQSEQARQARVQSLRMITQVWDSEFPREAWPAFAPKVEKLLTEIGPASENDPASEWIAAAKSRLS